MRTLFIVSTTLLVLSACLPLRTPTPPPTQTSLAQAPTTAPAAPQGGTAVAPPPGPGTTAPTAASAGPLLQVLSPQDGAVVNTPQVTITGASEPGAVVTVNDDILVVGPDGQFHDTVTLEEGPNVVEVIASNTSGSEASVELTIIYQP